MRSPEGTGPRLLQEILSIVPRDGRRVYDMRKVVELLVDGGDWLEVQPGIGTVVSARPPARAGDRRRLLDHEVEQLVVEALR